MPDGKKNVRVWCDGCYDMAHFGHANSLRQAKSLGDYLVVGVHSDDEIRKHKGEPVFNEEERYKMVRGMKWVDEVVEGVPYITSLETINKHNCDFCVHGDDVTTTTDGVDSYESVKKAGKYRVVQRMAGISTTDLIGRILSLVPPNEFKGTLEGCSKFSEESYPRSPYTGCSQFLPTTQKIMHFSDGKSPDPGDRVVYVAGAYDLFHVGHLDFLEKARAEGDYLIVGVFSDSTVKGYKGSNYPVMNLHERILNVLSCKYVSEVVIGAPYRITKDLMAHFGVDVVCHGTTPTSVQPGFDDSDPFEEPKAQGKFKQIDSKNSMTTEKIAERIIQNSIQFQNRNKNKELREIAAFQEREVPL